MLPKDDDLESGSADLFDRERIRDYIKFVAGSVRRRRRLLAAVIVCVMGSAIAALLMLPRTYRVEAKLLTQKNTALAVRSEDPNASAQTAGAADLIRRRENLVALIQATDLLNHWEQHRAPIQRMTDGISRVLGAKDSEQDRMDAMVERLEKKLTAWTSEGTVTIALEWQDARMAARLVDLAQQNFLEARYAQEITALSESVGILRTHAGNLRVDIDEAVSALEKLRASKQPKVEPAPAAAPGAAPVAEAPKPVFVRPQQPSVEVEQARVAIAAKQKTLDDLETMRRQRLSDLQARLAEQRATYTENYPSVIDLKQTIASLSNPSSQAKTLQTELATLKGTLDAASPGAAATGLRMPLGGAAATTVPQLPNDILRLEQDLREDRDPATGRARADLRAAMDKYAAIREKVAAAQIDLDIAQAAFKYRYSVLTPAQLPKKATKPNVPLVLVAALVVAILASIFVAVVADVRSGQVVERWQLERLLDRPILGEIEVNRLARRGVQ